MRVLIIDAFPVDDPGAHLVAAAVEVLESHGTDVEILSLADAEFDTTMTGEERRAYETDSPLLADETYASAVSVMAADALLFCYPTVLFGLPPRLKAWLERVMVLGVAFRFDAKQRVRPGLTAVRRLGVITTTPHSASATMRARDLGRRSIMRTLRLNCHPRCRRTFVRLAIDAPAVHVTHNLTRALRNWK